VVYDHHQIDNDKLKKLEERQRKTLEKKIIKKIMIFIKIKLD